MKKVIFLTGWFLIISLSFLTIIQVTPVALALTAPVFLTNYIQRVLGLLVFSLFFVQIILGAFMKKILNKLGGWIFNFHVFEGILVYVLVFLHPISYLLTIYFAGAGLDPYRVFVNACIICKSPSDYFLTLGRVSFWLLSISVFAALFRKATPWLKANWRKLHVLNYFIFLIVGLHGFFLGSDFRVQPFFTFAIVAYVIILGIIVFIEIPRLFKNFRNWVNS
jgi:predicted ferric reductase